MSLQHHFIETKIQSILSQFSDTHQIYSIPSQPSGPRTDCSSWQVPYAHGQVKAICPWPSPQSPSCLIPRKVHVFVQ